MSDSASTEFKPTIPNMVRTVVYATGLVVGFVTILATGLSAVWWPDLAVPIAQTGTVCTAAFGWLSSALGVAYRPTSVEYQAANAA